MKQPIKQISLTGQLLGCCPCCGLLSSLSQTLKKSTHLLVIRGAKGWSNSLSTQSTCTPNSKECPTNSFQKCNLILTKAVRVHNFRSQMIVPALQERKQSFTPGFLYLSFCSPSPPLRIHAFKSFSLFFSFSLFKLCYFYTTCLYYQL